MINCSRLEFRPELLKVKTETVTTLNDMLVACFGNQKQVSRLLGISVGAVRYQVVNNKNPEIIVEIKDGQLIGFRRNWGNHA